MKAKDSTVFLEDEELTHLSKAEQVEAALRQMKLLGLHDKALHEFEARGIILKSDGGELNPLTSKEQKIVSDWERDTGYLVYHVNKCIGWLDENVFVLYNIFYVPDNAEGCRKAEKLISKGGEDGGIMVFVYCVHNDIPEFSEFGSIIVYPVDGVLHRIY